MAMSSGAMGRLSSRSSTQAAAIGGRGGVWDGRGLRRSGGGARCSAAFRGRLADQYRTLRVQPGASEVEIKRAFRQLALQFHPDVCKGSNCSVQFHRINEAYDVVMSSLRQSEDLEQEEKMRWQPSEWNTDGGDDEPEWELWEEWMGWEGAGTRDYSSHINPFI